MCVERPTPSVPSMTISRPGSVLSWLYASNSFGAAIGVLVAGFYLVSRFDFPGTLIVAAALNFAAAAITVALVGRSSSFAATRACASARPARCRRPP